MKLKAISLNADIPSVTSTVETVALDSSKRLPSNPFVGLRPFESDESLLFFGRDKQIGELLQQLHRTQFVAVVGSSGCGKSSLIRAGLIPKLKAGFLVERRDHWQVALMKPGESPLTNLACTLLSAASKPNTPEAIAAFARDMRISGAEAINHILTSSLTQSDSNMLLVVDQFEELFRYDQPTVPIQPETTEAELVTAQFVDERRRIESAKRELRRDEAASFVATLLQLANQSELPIYVVITMRSDFLGDCDAFHGLPELINHTLYLVPRLNRQQRQQAIENPIRLYGQGITPRLLDTVVNDVGDESDQLPVMQHALMRTWEKWKEDKANPPAVDLPHYEAAGMISAALSRDADRALGELSKQDQAIAKRMFQALVETDLQGRNTRRPAHLDQLAQIADVKPNKILEVVDHFRREGRCFLTLSTDHATGDTLIDISHESFIRQWAKLGDWVKSENYSKDLYTRLAAAAQRHKSGWGGLLTDTELHLAVDWWEKRQPNEAWAVRYNHEFHNAKKFLGDSKLKSDQDAAEREHQRVKELESESIKQQNKKLRRYMYALGVLSLIAIISAGGTAFSFVRANRNARLAIVKSNEADRNREFAVNESNKAIEANRKLGESLAYAQQARDEAERQTAFANLEKARASEQAQIAQTKAAEAERAREDAQKQAAFAKTETKRANAAAAQAQSSLTEVRNAKEELRVAGERNVQALNEQRKDVIGRLGELYQKALSLAGDSDTIEDAVKTYEEILRVYENEDVRGGKLSTLLVLGRLFDGSLDEEAPERALGYYNQALPLFNASDPAEKTKKISTLIKMGDLLYDKKGTQAAADRFEEAIALGYQSSPQDSRDVYGKLGDFYGSSISVDKLNKAVDLYELRLAQLEGQTNVDTDEPTNPRVTQQAKLATQIKLATVYMRLGRTTEARERYEKALSFAMSPPLEQKPIDPLIRIGMSLNRPEEKEARDEYFRKAIESTVPAERAGVYKRVGDALNGLELPQDAILYFKEAEKLYGPKDAREAANLLRSFGLAYEKLNQKDTALQYYRQALESFEKLKISSMVISLRRKIATLSGTEEK